MLIIAKFPEIGFLISKNNTVSMEVDLGKGILMGSNSLKTGKKYVLV